MTLVSPFNPRKNGFLKFKIFDALWDKAGARPLFDLRFNLRSTIDQIQGIVPLFARAGSTKLAWDGTQFVSFAADVPAFELGADGVWDYLTEPAATNLVPRTDGTSGWTLNGMTTFGTPSSPIGPSNILQFRENTNNSEHYAERTIANNAVGVHCHSVRFRAVNKRYLWLRPIYVGEPSSTSMIIDCLLGTISPSGSPVTATIKRLKDDWFEVSISTSTLTGVSTYSAWRLHGRSSDSSQSTYTGDTNSGFDLYIPQVETGPIASSPIVTGGTTVIRASDNLSVTSDPRLSAILQSGDLTIYTEHIAIGWNGSNQFIAAMDQAAASTGFEEIRLFETNAGSITLTHATNNVQQTTLVFGTGVPGSVTRSVYAMGLNNSTGATNRASRPAADVGCINPPALDRLIIGSRRDGVFRHNMGMRRFCIFQGRLSNAQLDAMVTE